MEKVKIFEDTDINEQKEILEKLDIEFFEKWRQIISQWDSSNGKWYIIKNWEVSVLLNNIEIAVLKSWDIFWEIAVLSEEERTASVVANTDIECYIITQEDIIFIAENYSNMINKEIIDRIEMNNEILES